VISIGNIVAGGSGKTPAVMAVVKMLEEHTDLNMAVLSRGYRSKIRRSAVVSDGDNILLTADEAGDEPHLLGRSLPSVPVLIGKDRYETGLKAIREWNCKAIILDDGFQYLRLARDIDIITIDATRPFGLDHLLPRGYLREPLSNLRHADIILLTRVDQCENLGLVRGRLAEVAPSVPVFESIYEPRSLRYLDTDQDMGLDAIRGKNVLAVCGIANPASFADTLCSLGTGKVELLSFPDHHRYPLSSNKRIRLKAEESDADVIVTTEKDAPKLKHIGDYPVLSLTVELKLVETQEERFVELLIG
jgi:tetraacyldisaccharide 4'-kinase